MSIRKKILLSIFIIALVAAGIAGCLAYRNYRIYHDTYIVIDGTEYRRDASSLDLSGKPLVEYEKLKELTGLRQLNLRDTGLTSAQYDELHTALPSCEIRWSVPFQGNYIDDDITELTLTELTESDFGDLEYFTNLQKIDATNCRDYDALFALMEDRPDITYSYGISLSGRNYGSELYVLNVPDPDVDEILANLGYMPHVETVRFSGNLPENAELWRLVEAFPDILFIWEFDIAGVTACTTDEFLDLSGVTLEDTEELEAALPYFYSLTQVDMVDCGISNEEMDALNKRHEETKFVWTVNVAGMDVRTDATYFMPAKYHLTGVTSRSCENLKYCEDMVVLDFGHKGLTNVDFIQYMPNLRYLLLCETGITDLTVIGNCTSLEYLELQMNSVSDLTPLTNLTNLADLNISWTDYDGEGQVKALGSLSPLLQMTWLDRLWMIGCELSSKQKQLLRESLPNTVLRFSAEEGLTTGGFRYTLRYYEQRDILGMYYMHN